MRGTDLLLLSLDDDEDEAGEEGEEEDDAERVSLIMDPFPSSRATKWL